MAGGQPRFSLPLPLSFGRGFEVEHVVLHRVFHGAGRLPWFSVGWECVGACERDDAQQCGERGKHARQNVEEVPAPPRGVLNACFFPFLVFGQYAKSIMRGRL